MQEVRFTWLECRKEFRAESSISKCNLTCVTLRFKEMHCSVENIVCKAKGTDPTKIGNCKQFHLNHDHDPNDPHDHHHPDNNHDHHPNDNHDLEQDNPDNNHAED